MTERARLLAHARKCRDLARAVDERTAATLRGMAKEYSERAAKLPPEEPPEAEAPMPMLS